MKFKRLSRRTIAATLWLAGVIACCVVIARTTITADLSAFLPQTPTREQQVLVDQLRDGLVSRLILVGIEGADETMLATLSKEVAAQLRGDPMFATVNNGEPVNRERDQAFLFKNRYLLSPSVSADRFTAAGLHDAISDTIDLLASPAGLLVKPLLARDPTGELVQILERFQSQNQPATRNGVWASRDGKRALLLAQTRATAEDIDAQQRAMNRIQEAFDAAAQRHGATAAKLVMTGPGVFSVRSRQTIESEVSRLAIVSAAIVVTLLLLIYRSFTALLLGLLPVVSGALAGIVAVSLGYGVVHGLTLGFGTTLIGEAVDYSIYLFIQSRQRGMETGGAANDWLRQFWPTIRLGVLTSIAGFAALLLSSFPGLGQLGLYSITGLAAAALVTRFVLPHLLPATFRIRDVSGIGFVLSGVAARASLLCWPAALVIGAAGIVLIQHRADLWNNDISALSPVSVQDQQIDARLRADTGAPDARYMIVVSGDGREAVMQATESVSTQLQALVDTGALAGFETPSRYLPSIATQRLRQNSLPGSGVKQALAQATQGLPLRPQALDPFIQDVAAAKQAPLIARADLDQTSFALAVDSLLFQRDGRWSAFLPLTAPESGLDVTAIRAALAAANQPNALFVDMKKESDNLYSGYMHEALLLSAGALAAVAMLLLLSLRSPVRLVRTMLPLLGAVVTVMAILALSGQRLTILHLIGLLLIVAVGSNYALFFNGCGNDKPGDASGMQPQTLTSIVFANLTTVASFGVLGFSTVPVLQAIGTTVGSGAILALLFSAAFGKRQSASTDTIGK